MAEPIRIRVNGNSVEVSAGTSVAVAILVAGEACRTSVSGQKRGPLCGMGTCFECRATLNGAPHTRTCQVLCEPGMDIQTT
jgi:sarcosine oxidase subunit alpha